MPKGAWDVVLDTEGEPRQAAEAGVVELTALLRERPGGTNCAVGRPTCATSADVRNPTAATTSLFEQIDGWRYRLIATNTPADTAQFLEARHRPHARLEDSISCSNQTGLGHLPSASIAINRAWYLAATIACDLLAWLRLLCLDGPLARTEPKTLR